MHLQPYSTRLCVFSYLLRINGWLLCAFRYMSLNWLSCRFCTLTFLSLPATTALHIMIQDSINCTKESRRSIIIEAAEKGKGSIWGNRNFFWLQHVPSWAYLQWFQVPLTFYSLPHIQPFVARQGFQQVLSNFWASFLNAEFWSRSRWCGALDRF